MRGRADPVTGIGPKLTPGGIGRHRQNANHGRVSGRRFRIGRPRRACRRRHSGSSAFPHRAPLGACGKRDAKARRVCADCSCRGAATRWRGGIAPGHGRFTRCPPGALSASRALTLPKGVAYAGQRLNPCPETRIRSGRAPLSDEVSCRKAKKIKDHIKQGVR